MKTPQNHINPITGYKTSPHPTGNTWIASQTLINTQEDYDYHIALLHYCINNLMMDFGDSIINILEHAKPFKETNKPFGMIGLTSKPREILV